ncbi:flavin-dependent dehydrogenase [Leptolyngbya sp. FACHB-36]|uniref:NAD(P)/FAD-dependent oxidoreductase n=1 Tax=Leptolyngbya sp. FACHB-36 TaxID=2692808 RepID=UPI0016819D92|nr:flavin-dependent dehydrogenase [Leptolyngbya sp. FACHB-36]MBD2021634.1 flavin-dependent dehydrogenase [Leptolyngbya sp. FACHB-36]
MKEILYIEVPSPDVDAVKQWLQQSFTPEVGEKVISHSGIRLTVKQTTHQPSSIPESQSDDELSFFVWSVQRTTYLKVFRWTTRPILHENRVLEHFVQAIRSRFPHTYPEPPAIDLTQQSIFEALSDRYPLTTKYFQRMPNGESDLTRVYWWEQRWRDGVRNPKQPKQVVFWGDQQTQTYASPTYDLIYIGGALGVIHAATMARLGYRVLLIERLPFGRMNREWNISRSEFQSVIDLGLFTAAEFEGLIAREYVDGFHKFFDGNNPPQAKAAVLHTPTVLNVGLDAEKLLRLCGQKLKEAGGEIWDETEFVRADINAKQVVVQTQHLPTGEQRDIRGRLLIDAMGTASPIAWQLNGGRAFDSVCPTVGAVISSGFEPGVWDACYGDVLNSHGDTSRGRQLIWELFPAEGEELTFYLFHYHQPHPDNPGSLLELYEDFFTILPEYRRCDMDKLVWKKPTFGYIPGHFSVSNTDRQVAVDRLIALGDAASLQSPLVFTGFGSLVRNLPRLTALLDTALKHDLLTAKHLNQIRAYQSNVSVTWLFSKGMMVPTGRHIPPARINTLLNVFFGLLAKEQTDIAEQFIKDRVGWFTFNRLAIATAWRIPTLLIWIWTFIHPRDFLRWLGSYRDFTMTALLSAIVGGWSPNVLRRLQPWLEPRFPGLWLWLLAQSYVLTDGVGAPQPIRTKAVRTERATMAIGENHPTLAESE